MQENDLYLIVRAAACRGWIKLHAVTLIISCWCYGIALISLLNFA